MNQHPSWCRCWDGYCRQPVIIQDSESVKPMIVGCYTLDLYCVNTETVKHSWRRHFAQFSGNTYEECKAQAKQAGWKFVYRNDEEDVICPDCMEKGTPAT